MVREKDEPKSNFARRSAGFVSSPKYRMLPAWQRQLMERCRKCRDGDDLVAIRMEVQAMNLYDCDNRDRRDKVLEQIDRFLDKIVPRLQINLSNNNFISGQLDVEKIMRETREKTLEIEANNSEKNNSPNFINVQANEEKNGN